MDHNRGHSKIARPLSLLISIYFLVCISTTVIDGQVLVTTFPAGEDISGSSEKLVRLRMLGAQPTSARLTQCTGFTLTDPANNPFWVTQLKGYAPPSTVHHLVLYGCSYKPTGSACSCSLKDRSSIFASVRNTPEIRFPSVVNGLFQTGLQIGGSSLIQYVFLEIHYVGALESPDSTTGVDLRYKTTDPYLYIGIYSIMGVGAIPQQTTPVILDSCISYNSTSPQGFMGIFGYQVHTHGLGKQVGIYIRDNFGNIAELGRANPLFPQAYYPATNFGDAMNGAKFYLRCIYDSSQATSTTYTSGVTGQVGSEMCIGSLLYYTTIVPGKKNSFSFGSCTGVTFPAASTTLLPANAKLTQHAQFGNQTGFVKITTDGKYFMNLGVENFSTIIN